MSSLYLLKELQTVRVVIICKIDNPGLAAVYAVGLPEPPQGQIPLYRTSRYSGVPRVPMYLIVPRCLHIQVGVIKACLLEEMANQSCLPLAILY